MDTACQTDRSFLDLLLAYCVPAANPSRTCEDELTDHHCHFLCCDFCIAGHNQGL